MGDQFTAFGRMIRHSLRPSIKVLTMRVPRSSLPVLALVLAASSPPAGAQSLDRRLGPRPVDVTVSYSLMLPVRSNAIDDQKQALENGRRAMYEMASTECKNLLATIALSCQLSRLNVQSNIQRGNNNETTIISASASYQIQLKDADNGR